MFYAAVQMKKNRPGTLVTVLAHPATREAIAAVLFAHTTTIGVRYQEMLRDRLDREIRVGRDAASARSGSRWRRATAAC